MTRKEIEKILETKNSTVLDFPERGIWGSGKYRGNCSGWVIAYLIWRYNVKSLAELFAGGGTGSDVCKDMNIPYIGADLNPNPVRANIISIDAIYDDVPDEFRNKEMLFMHPPYGAEIGIPYAGSMYDDPTGELSKSDLGQMPWNKFMQMLNMIIMKYYAAMVPGSKMAILMGDVRKRGIYHSMFTDIVVPGTMLQTYIKIQNNYTSKNRKYNSVVTPIEHEMMYVVEKTLDAYLIQFKMPSNHKKDIRDSSSATWKDVVMAVMKHIGKETDLQSIYAEIESHDKCKMNPHWKDKVRQTLQCGLFVNVSRGVWRIAA